MKRPAAATKRGAALQPFRALKRPASALRKKPAGASAKGKKSGLKAWEARLWREGFEVVAGTDEAGRGPWAGPVVAAAFAVLAKDDAEVRDLLAIVADSKRMSAKQRDVAFEQLTDPKWHGRTVWAIAEASAEQIDSSDILRASLGAMNRAVRDMSVRPDCVLVDGCCRPPALLEPGACWTRGSKKAKAKALMRKPARVETSEAASPVEEPLPVVSEQAPDWLPRRVEAVISGDGLVPSISAASVLAKVHRDRLMEQLHEEYPMYGFSSHKGYGTAEHMKAIAKHGVTAQHRRSFAPIAAALRKRPAMAERQVRVSKVAAAKVASDPVSPPQSRGAVATRSNLTPMKLCGISELISSEGKTATVLGS